MYYTAPLFGFQYSFSITPHACNTTLHSQGMLEYCPQIGHCRNCLTVPTLALSEHTSEEDKHAATNVQKGLVFFFLFSFILFSSLWTKTVVKHLNSKKKSRRKNSEKLWKVWKSVEKCQKPRKSAETSLNIVWKVYNLSANSHKRCRKCPKVAPLCIKCPIKSSPPKKSLRLPRKPDAWHMHDTPESCPQVGPQTSINWKLLPGCLKTAQTTHKTKRFAANTWARPDHSLAVPGLPGLPLKGLQWPQWLQNMSEIASRLLESGASMCTKSQINQNDKRNTR